MFFFPSHKSLEKKTGISKKRAGKIRLFSLKLGFRLSYQGDFLKNKKQVHEADLFVDQRNVPVYHV